MSTHQIKLKQLRRLKFRNIFLNTVCILLALAGISWTVNYFWKYARYEITNDAVVDQYIAPLNIRIPGYIKEVRFTEHQYVHAGDTLLILDDREYRIRLKDAEAALMDALGSKEVLNSGIRTSGVNVAVQEANIAETLARLSQQEAELNRYTRLLKKQAVSQQDYELAKANFEATRARYNALLRQKEAAQSQYSETSKRSTGAEANILRKEADLEMARLNLSYTVVTAPYDGYTGRRTLEPGQFVQGGQTLSYLVRGNDKWVTANYKETQIAHIYIGQKVRIKVDAFSGRTFHGTVTAISEATGSKYSLVPTDNSAGNFVKVQQRIPVRIDLNDASPEEMECLRAGMMVETEAVRPWAYGEAQSAYPSLGASMVGHRDHVYCHLSHHPAQRCLHRKYGRSIEHAGSIERRYYHGLLFSFGRDGCCLSHRTENTHHSHSENLTAH